jgi:hypothetical protein
MFTFFVRLGLLQRKPRRTPRDNLLRASRRPAVEILETRTLPAPLTWNAGINLPEARGGVAAAMQNGAVAVFDGSNADVPALTVSNPTWQGSYSMDAFLPAAVAYPGVGTLPDGTALVFGGQQNGVATSSAIDYDYTGDGTAAAANMHTARAFFGFATDPNNNVYAIGGINQSGSRQSSVEYYTQDSNSWTLVASLPQTLSNEPAVSDGAGHIFTFGGVGANGAITKNVYDYTIATNKWSQVASLPFGVRDSAAVLGGNGRIYVLGGITASGTTAAVESYSPTSNTWNTEAPLPSPVSSEAIVSDPLGRIEVIGGFDSGGNPVANVWISQQLNVPDTAPVFTTPPVTQLYSWSQLYYQVLTSGNPQPTYKLTAAPTGMTIDPITGLINWFPTSSQVGNQNVTIEASNYAGSTTQSFTISLVAPTLPATTPAQATALAAYSFTVPSTGNPTPTFSLVSGPAGMYMTQPSIGTVYWTPTLAEGGPQTFTVQASNYIGQVTQTYTVDVVSSIPLNVTAVGASTTSITVSWLPVDDSAGATYDVYRRVGHIHGGYSDVLVASGVTGTSATIGGLTESKPGQAGYSFVVRATDNSTGVQSQDSLPATSPTLFPPQLAGVSVNGTYVSTVQVQQGSTVRAQILWYANEAPTFSLVSGPSTMSVDRTTGIVSFTAGSSESDIGNFNAVVQATNSVGSATETIPFSVTDALPTLNITGLPTNNTVTEGTSVNVTATGSAGTPAENASGLTFSWTVTKVHNGVTTTNFAQGSGSGSSTPISFTADDEGTYTLSVTGTDVNGASTTVSDVITSTTVAPTTGFSGPGDAVTYQTRLFTLTASSPSSVDQASPFTFAINWGDGNSQNVTADSGTVVSHSYTATGTYTVGVTATDAGGVVGNNATQNVVVKAAQVENDPASLGGSVGLAIGGTSGNDSIQISTGATSGTVTVTLNGASLGTFTPTNGDLFVFGGPGTDTLTFKAPSGAGAYNLTGQTLTYGNSGSGVPLFNLTLALAPDVEALVVQGGNTGSAYTIQDATVSTTVNAGSGNDTFTFADTGAATQPVAVNGGGGTNTLIGSNLSNFWHLTGSGAGTLQGGSEPADPFTGVQNLTGGSGADTFHFANNTAAIGGSIDGKGGANALDYSGRTTAVTMTLVSSGLNKGTGIAGAWTNVQTLIGSQATTDTLIGPNAAETWTINGTNSGTVAGVTFSGIESLTGGSGNDTFIFSGSGNVTGSVNGGGGTNTIDVSGYTGASTVNLQTRTATPIGGTFSSITSLVGDNSTSTLIGPNATTTWSITATNKGTVGSTSFSGFVNLTGGTGNDNFKLSNGVGVTGTIDGGAGANTLDYSAYTTGIIVDLLIPTATNIGAIKNIQNVNSGTGNSILVGNGGSNNFTVKGGRNLVIGGGGSYKLTGGTGQDILIAGTTSYDSNLPALTAILAYWAQTNLTYAQEVNGLSTVGVTYQDSSGTHIAILNTSTVFDNGVVDTLAGGSGLDWFFAHRTASNQDVVTGWRNGEVITDI